MLKKTLLAAAVVAGITVSVRAAPPDDPDKPKDASDSKDGDKAVELKQVEVRGTAEGLKAESQSSAGKFALPLRETPQSVTVITQESLRDRQIFDFGQALEVSAGVNQFSGTGPFAGMSSFGFSDVAIRGIAIDGYNDVRKTGSSTTRTYRCQTWRSKTASR
jgi:outer membrane receptor for ferric coprogen and ferric-rhodotorulic acid